MPVCIACSLFTLGLIPLLTAHKMAIHNYALCIKSGKKVNIFPVWLLWGKRAVFIRVVFTSGVVESGVFTLVVRVMHKVVWIVEKRESYYRLLIFTAYIWKLCMIILCPIRTWNYQNFTRLFNHIRSFKRWKDTYN